MKKLFVIKNLLQWTLLLLIGVEFILAYYYGWELNLLTKGNRLYVYGLETIIFYSLAEDLFKFLSRLKSPERPIVVGDVVMLKSGGPKMTVNFQNRYEGFSCSWFEAGKSQSGYFKPEILKRA